MNEKKSVKKTMGTVGCLVFFGVCIQAAVRDLSLVETVLTALGLLIFALFGIKSATGVMIQNGIGKKVGKDE